MAGKGKQCNLCINFFKYYIKNETRFQATKFGFCNEKQDSTQVFDTCDKWEFRRIRHSKRQLEQKINDLLTEIKEIKSILEAEQDENEDM